MTPSRALIVLSAFAFILAPAHEAISQIGGERCCFTDGTCSELPIQDCGPAGGIDFPGLCQPQGCCLPNGTCTNTDPECCTLAGGMPTGSLCNDPVPCRLPDNTCKNLEPTCCMFSDGTPLPGTSCPDVQPCCLAGGCELLDTAVCEEIGGTPHFGTSCTTGRACCLPDGTCDDSLDVCACGNLEGISSVGLCSQPEACCIGDNPNGRFACESLDPVCCAGQNGVSSKDACGVPQACCLPKGACDDSLDPCECKSQGGTSAFGTCAELCCGTSFGPFQQKPPLFNSKQDLCNAFHGFPLPQNLIPPPNPVSPTVPRDNEPYMARLQQFLNEGRYQQFGWLHDRDVRTTGGTHVPVHIYYSPEVIDWLCADRKGKCNGVGPRVCRRDSDCSTSGETCELLPPRRDDGQDDVPNSERRCRFQLQVPHHPRPV